MVMIEAVLLFQLQKVMEQWSNRVLSTIMWEYLHKKHIKDNIIEKGLSRERLFNLLNGP